MDEAGLNSIIQRSFIRESWGHKLQDPLGGRGTARPFDGIHIINGLPGYYETKIQKKLRGF